MPKLPLDDRIVAQLQEYVAAGEYADPSAVLRDGLRWINPRVATVESDHALQEARAEYDADEMDDLSTDGLNETEREGVERAGRTVSIELDADVVERIMAVLGDRTGQADFANESAVVSRALFLLEDRRKFFHLRKLIAEAEAEFERGEYIRWRPGMMKELLELGRQRARDGLGPNPDVI